MSKNTFKKSGLFVLGFIILIAGIILILAWWPDLVIVFKGTIGFILALAGLLMLYTVKELK